jgi:hypothetical protein
MSSFIRFKDDDKTANTKRYGGKNEYGVKVANKVLDFVGNLGGPLTSPFVLTAKLMLSVSTSDFFTKEMIEKIKGYHKNLEEYIKLLNVFDYLEKTSENVISYPVNLSNIQNAIGGLIAFLYGFISQEKEKKKTMYGRVKSFFKKSLIAYTLESIDTVITSSMTQIVSDIVAISSFMIMQMLSLSATNNALYLKLMSNTMQYYVKPQESPKLQNLDSFYETAKQDIEVVVNDIATDIDLQKRDAKRVEQETVSTTTNNNEKLVKGGKKPYKQKEFTRKQKFKT